MAIDAFVFESDKGREFAKASARLADSKTVDELCKLIRLQGTAREFPIILGQILYHGMTKGGSVPVEKLPSLIQELERLKTEEALTKKFKKDLLSLCKTAMDTERPIIF